MRINSLESVNTSASKWKTRTICLKIQRRRSKLPNTIHGKKRSGCCNTDENRIEQCFAAHIVHSCQQYWTILLHPIQAQQYCSILFYECLKWDYNIYYLIKCWIYLWCTSIFILKTPYMKTKAFSSPDFVFTGINIKYTLSFSSF